MKYQYPPISMLKSVSNNIVIEEKRLKEMAEEIVKVMSMWKVSSQVVDIRVTPMSICFEVMPEMGSSVKTIKKMKADIELRIGMSIEIMYKNISNHTITIAALPKDRPLIGLRNVLESDAFKNAESPLSFAAGFNYNGDAIVVDIEQLPHMLVAGTTGSGKTVFLDDIVMSLMFKASPEEVKMIMIDPKGVDLSYYNGIPHLLAPVVYDSHCLFGMLDWVETEMMRRYDNFSSLGVKNIKSYNELCSGELLPQILVIIDEYSEFMLDYKSEFESILDRISRLGRAAGIHLIIATQRPTVDVVTSSIKANLPCRASFTVVDSRESNAIINKAGFQRLCGAGDMLFSLNVSSETEHVQAAYVSENEIKSVVEIMKQYS